MAGALAARGIGPLERLDELAAEVGLHVTGAASVRASAPQITAVMAALRADPPRTIGGYPVRKFADWLETGSPHPADLVELELGALAVDHGNDDVDARVRVCIRPSGTEPKAKIYLEAVAQNPGDIPAERRRLRSLLGAIAAEVSAWFERA